MVVRVNVDLKHAEGRPIQINWEIIDASNGEVQSLSKAWLRNFAAYRLRATTDPDSGFFKLWIPLPDKRGDYVISLTASQGEGLPLAERSTDTQVH